MSEYQPDQMIKDVEVFWASVHTVNKISGKHEITLVNLTDEQVQWFKEFGGSIGLWNKPKFDPSKPDMGFHIKLKSNKALRYIVDKDNKPTTELIGNGSRCNIIFTPKEVKSAVGKDTHVMLYLNGVQVTELVPYKGAEAVGFSAV